jgi:hypothetical protein
LPEEEPMSSRDFYLNPETLSNLFLSELERQGYWPLKGWRSNRQDVQVQTEDGRVVSVNVDGSNKVVITAIDLAAKA